MGCICSTKKDIEYNLDELRKNIKEYKLDKFFNFDIIIDGTASNTFKDGSSIHNISIEILKNNNTNINPYLTVLKIIDEINSHNKMYIYGTYKANLNENKIEEIDDKYNDNDNDKSNSPNINNHININNINIVNKYIGIIKSIQEKKFGLNYYSSETNITNILDKLYAEKKSMMQIIIISDDDKCIGSGYEFSKKIANLSHKFNSVIFIGIGDNEFHNIKNLKISGKRLYDNLNVFILNDLIKRPLINNKNKEDIFKQIFKKIVNQYLFITQYCINKKMAITSQIKTKNNLSVLSTIYSSNTPDSLQRKLKNTTTNIIKDNDIEEKDNIIKINNIDNYNNNNNDNDNNDEEIKEETLKSRESLNKKIDEFLSSGNFVSKRK